jgi:hypothetical protein
VYEMSVFGVPVVNSRHAASTDIPAAPSGSLAKAHSGGTVLKSQNWPAPRAQRLPEL